MLRSIWQALALGSLVITGLFANKTVKSQGKKKDDKSQGKKKENKSQGKNEEEAAEYKLKKLDNEKYEAAVYMISKIDFDRFNANARACSMYYLIKFKKKPRFHV